MVALIMWGLVQTSHTTTYVAPEPERVVEVIEPEVVEVDVIQKRIADAQNEAMAEINAKADTMRGEFVANELKKIEATVLAEIEKELKARRIDVEKQTGLY